jgi:hypothetical protein
MPPWHLTALHQGRSKLRRYLTRALWLVIPVLSVTPAALGSDGHRPSSTFAGTCELSGTLTSHPPLTTEARFVRSAATAHGRCTGRFTDRHGHVHELDGDPVAYVARASGHLSCGPGGQASGSGVLRFHRGSIRFRFSEVREVGTATLRLDGAGGGLALGEASVSPEEDPLEILAKCTGKGLDEVAVDISLATTPAISG